MLHGIPVYQGTSPVHSKQFLIRLSFCYSPVPVLQGAALLKLTGYHQLHPMFRTLLTWYALFLIAI